MPVSQTTPVTQTIQIHRDAPLKPRVGAPCNGCGVCCLAEPCPIGVVLSGRRHGACRALRWEDTSAMYRCGALLEPKDVLEQALPKSIQGLAVLLAPVLKRLGGRWIAAGMGCDSTLEPAAPAEFADNPAQASLEHD